MNERVLKIGNKKDNKHFFKIISRNCFTIRGIGAKLWSGPRGEIYPTAQNGAGARHLSTPPTS